MADEFGKNFRQVLAAHIAVILNLMGDPVENLPVLVFRQLRVLKGLEIVVGEGGEFLGAHFLPGGGPIFEVHLQAAGGEVTAAQERILVGDTQDGLLPPGGVRLLLGGGKQAGESPVEKGRQKVGAGLATGGVLEVGGLVPHQAKELLVLLLALPADKAAEPPVGEVLFGDRLAAETGIFEDGADLREGIEPGEDFGAAFAVIDAAVELLPDGLREAGDFAGGG